MARNSFKVNEKGKTVIAYRLSLSETDYKTLERYKALGYDVSLLDRQAPQKRTGIKAEQLVKYLKGVIPDNIYNEYIERNNKKQNFLKTKSWLITTLKEEAERTKKEFIPLEQLIQQGRELESSKSILQGTIESKRQNKIIDIENKEQAKIN